ncbi:carboxypeptidase-like regulatory domain-containing protein [Lutibacter sp. B1]|uniref:carboxypeptidase-like regulatory domain-containing protein n=1 Tax=Lutibacter sp. B1 TaxID=2725996 RepID=UPI001456B85B|nr:carboxypeptidase-like regulatory domain-containing protein [Lutibacter sp. B1]NLP57264.1 carboxypeptidase-like regulatory domain-containing protein [Lutibacter sp. B1]
MRVILFTILLFTSTQFFGQSFKVDSFFSDSNRNGKIEGVILDSENEENPLAFADISVKDTSISTTSEIDGTFSLNLKPGKYTLIISFIGYKTTEVSNVIVTSNQPLKFNQKLIALEMNSDISSNNFFEK